MNREYRFLFGVFSLLFVAMVVTSGTVTAAIITPVGAVSDTQFGNRSPNNLINSHGLNPGGSPADMAHWSHNGNADYSMWQSNNGSPAAVLTFDLGSTQTLDGIWVWNYAEHTVNRNTFDGTEKTGQGAKNVTIYRTSTLNANAAGGAGDTLIKSYEFQKEPGISFFDVFSEPLENSDGTFNPNAGYVATWFWNPVYYQFTNGSGTPTPITAQFIKLHIQGNWNGNQNGTGLSEVRFQTANTPIPEPSTITLIVFGLLGLTRFGRRIRRLG